MHVRHGDAVLHELLDLGSRKRRVFKHLNHIVHFVCDFVVLDNCIRNLFGFFLFFGSVSSIGRRLLNESASEACKKCYLNPHSSV